MSQEQIDATEARKPTRTVLTTPQEPKKLATITAWPAEVFFEVDLGRDNVITPEQAIEIGKALIAAAEESQTIEWDDDNGDELSSLVRVKR